MRRLLTCVLLSVLALPLTARADGSIQLVARAGVAKSFGDIGNGQQLSDSVSWAFPLEAQLAFRIAKQLALGAYGRYAPTVAASACAGCTIDDVGFGALAEYRFSEKLEGGPWLGFSAGYEQLKTSAGGGGSGTVTGFEGAVSTGADFEVGGLTLGPYVQLSLGQFGKSTSGGESRSIASKGMHAFFAAGVRIALLL